jgi:hypothetical protein
MSNEPLLDDDSAVNPQDYSFYNLLYAAVLLWVHAFNLFYIFHCVTTLHTQSVKMNNMIVGSVVDLQSPIGM